MGTQFEPQGHLLQRRHTSHHPQSDELVEPLNRTILNMLATTIKDHGEKNLHVLSHFTLCTEGRQGFQLTYV